MTETSNALKLHSPVYIERPVDDVHTNCEGDVELICNNLNMDVHNNIMSDTMQEDRMITNLEERNDETLLPRRLGEMETETAPKSRSFSIQVGLQFNNKDPKHLDQRVKDNTRYLNYGPEKDTCLWNAFDARRVSSQCASALTRVNGIIDYPQIEYSDEYENVGELNISISIPIIALLLLTLGCMLVRELCNEGDDTENDQDNDIDMVDSEYQILDETKSEYQLLDETKRIPQTAGHMKPRIF